MILRMCREHLLIDELLAQDARGCVRVPAGAGSNELQTDPSGFTLHRSDETEAAETASSLTRSDAAALCALMAAKLF